VRFGREVDDGVGGRDERRDDVRVGDVAADERQPRGLLGIGSDRVEVRLVAGVGELVEDRDPHPVASGEDIADERAADEPGAARHEEVRARPEPLGRRHEPATSVAWGRPSSGRCGGGASVPSASSLAASSAARSSDGTVPASVHWPS